MVNKGNFVARKRNPLADILTEKYKDLPISFKREWRKLTDQQRMDVKGTSDSRVKEEELTVEVAQQEDTIAALQDILVQSHNTQQEPTFFDAVTPSDNSTDLIIQAANRKGQAPHPAASMKKFLADN